MTGYTYARLGRGDLGFYRLFGEGLGNTLFPWARSMLAARGHSLREIWPAWRQVFHRGGLRDTWKDAQGSYGLKNLRNYDTLFAPTGEQATGWSKLAALLGGRKIPEERLRDPASVRDGVRAGEVVVFEGLGNHFADLEGQHEFLRGELWRRTAPSVRSRVIAEDFRHTICLHVRMGDFPAHPLEEAMRTRHNSRLPQAWYVEKACQLRAALGADWPVLVFSDGRDAELTEVLALPGARRVTFGNALADIWAMSAASALVCSLSTMNNWACFLGRPPSLRLRGVNARRLYTTGDPAAETECGVGEELPASFVDLVRARAALADPWPISNLAAPAGRV